MTRSPRQSVHDNLVLSATRTQSLVSLSSSEAEYIALAMTAAELLLIKVLIDDLGIQYEDNQVCTHILHKRELKRLKNVDVIVIYTAREISKFYKVRVSLRSRRLVIESETYQVLTFRVTKVVAMDY